MISADGHHSDAIAASELVVLQTCNRVEVYFARESGALPGSCDLATLASTLGIERDDPLRAGLQLRRGRAAARHLFRVAASLDSLVVGEAEILAQVREAYARSRAVGLTGALLDPLFESAFQVAKQVRVDTDLARHSVSVVALGVSVAITWPEVAVLPLMIVLGAAGVFVPVAVYPMSYTSWQALDLVMRPVSADDFLDESLAERRTAPH